MLKMSKSKPKESSSKYNYNIECYIKLKVPVSSYNNKRKDNKVIRNIIENIKIDAGQFDGIKFEVVSPRHTSMRDDFWPDESGPCEETFLEPVRNDMTAHQIQAAYEQYEKMALELMDKAAKLKELLCTKK